MKELKPSTKLDGTPEENERAIQRIRNNGSNVR